METDNNNNGYSIAADELRQIIERRESLEQEKKAIADQIKDVMAEAKGRGYCTKTLTKIIAIRKKDPMEVSEEEMLLDTYKAALGM